MAEVPGQVEMARRAPFGSSLLVVGMPDRSPVDLVRWLRDDGYLVAFSPTGVDATERIRRAPPDALILRPPLPDTEARQFVSFVLSLDVPVAIIVVVADAPSAEVARWLELGVDDCVVGHDPSDELLARTRLALRRRHGDRPAVREVVEYAGVRFDLAAHAVTAHGVPLELSRVEYRVLLALVRAEGRMLSPNELLSDVWGEHDATAFALRKVWMAVSRVRGALRDATRCTSIETIPRVGYRLVTLPDV